MGSWPRLMPRPPSTHYPTFTGVSAGGEGYGKTDRDHSEFLGEDVDQFDFQLVHHGLQFVERNVPLPQF